jgi:hypothetical protein
MSNAIRSKIYQPISAVIAIAALIGLTSCEATMKNTLTPPPIHATFGSSKVGSKALVELGEFEKSLLPSTGFVFITGGTTTKSAAYVFDFSAASLTMIQAADSGRPVNMTKDQKQKIKISEEAQSEILRLSNLIWKSEKSYANFPPKRSSFDVRLILADQTAVKDITSYGPAKFEVQELFDLILKLAP